MAEVKGELLFCDTFIHEEEDDLHLDLVQFNVPVAVEEVRVIPRGTLAHPDLKDGAYVGQTSPTTFKVEIFVKSLTDDGSAIFEKVGTLEYIEGGPIQVFPKSQVKTNNLVVRGRYQKLTLAVYGFVGGKPVQRSPSPPPPPPPPPPKAKPHKLKQEEEVSQIETIETIPSIHPAEWEWGQERQPVPEPPFPVFIEHENIGIPVEGPELVQPQPRRGPRTPSPPPPSSEHWNEGDPPQTEWQTEDQWVEGQPLEPPVEEPNEEWYGSTRWETTDSWEPHDGPDWDREEGEQTSRDEFKDEWKREQRKSRKNRGPRTPPGEPKSPHDFDERESRKGRRRDRDDDGDGRGERDRKRRRQEEPPFEPLSPEHSPRRSYDGDRDVRRELMDEAMAVAYEVISDEEVLEEITNVSNFLDPTDMDGIDDTWLEINIFLPYQAEIKPLKVLAGPDQTWFERERRRHEREHVNEEPSENLKKLSALLAEFQSEDHNARWVTAMEDIIVLANPHLSYLRHDDIKVLCDWTIEALDYSKAQTQPIAVNIRQLKVGMRLAACLMDCGPEVTDVLLKMGVQNKLFDLLFESHMATSLKMMILKAVDCSTNCAVGLDAFLVTPTDQSSSCYQRLLKFLLIDQTVRVVQAGTALLQKVHIFEVLGTLHRRVDKVLSGAPTPKHLPESSSDPPPSKPEGETPRPPSSLAESPSDPQDPKASLVAVDYESLDDEDADKLMQCLKEILMMLCNAEDMMVQPLPLAFPTSSAPSIKKGDSPWPVLYHMFAERKLLESLTFLISCPITAGNENLVTAVRDIIATIAHSYSGMLYLASQPEATKMLFQSLTSNEDEEADDVSLQQLGLDIIHKVAALQVLDSLLVKSSQRPPVGRDSVEMVDLLSQACSLNFNPLGRSAVAKVFGSEDNIKLLVALLRPKVNPKEELEVSAPKKMAVDGYLKQLISVTLQYNDDVHLLEKYGELLIDSIPSDSNQLWVAPLKGLKVDMTAIPSLIEYIQSNCDDLARDMMSSAPGILTCLRVLAHLACTPETAMQSTTDKQKNLQYKTVAIQLFGVGAMNVFSTAVQKLSDVLLLPWQLGHCLKSTQQHIVSRLATLLLRLMKSMLVELLGTGTVEFRDERPISSLLSLYIVMCSAPPSGSLDHVTSQVQTDIVEIMLMFTVIPITTTESEEALTNSSWSLMLKKLLEFIPRSPYTYLGGFSLLSDLLPLPLPIQAQENLSDDEVKKAVNFRKLWSVYLLCQKSLIQDIIVQLASTSSPPLQHILRRVLCQMADLAAPAAMMVTRSVLEALACNLTEKDGKLEQCSLEANQILSLFVSLISQPAIKAAFLHLVGSNMKPDDHLFEILNKLVTLLNISSESPAHMQTQECIVALLQSVCAPDITVLSDENLPVKEQLANSLPGKDHMQVICSTLVDHVISPDHSYASILPALRMMGTLLVHDYGFLHLKSVLEKQSGLFFDFLERLFNAFTRDSSDYLSTLSTAIDLLLYLMNQEVYTDEDNLPETSRYRILGLSPSELCSIVKWPTETSHPLKELEKICAECCKEDEKLESLLESLRALLQFLDSEDPANKTNAGEIELPSPMILSEQFNARLVYYVSEEEDDRFVPGIWTGLPPMDELDVEPEMVKCDLEEIRLKFFPDFNLQEELAKGLMADKENEKKKNESKLKSRHGRRRYEALTSRGFGRFPSNVRRAHSNMFQKRGRHNDIFRQRAQNTSRPPSMHVDDFMMQESGEPGGDKEGNYNRGPPPRRGMGPPRPPRGSRGGYPGSRMPWNGPPGPFRRDGPPHPGPPRGRGQWSPRRPMRPGYHQGPPDRNYMSRRPDGRSEGRHMEPYSYRSNSLDRNRGPYRGGMRGMGQRGSPSPRRGRARGGHWTGDYHMSRYGPPGKPSRGGRPQPPGRHSRSFTR